MSLEIVTTDAQPTVTIDAGSLGVVLDVGGRSGFTITRLLAWPVLGRPLSLGARALTIGGRVLALNP